MRRWRICSIIYAPRQGRTATCRLRFLSQANYKQIHTLRCEQNRLQLQVSIPGSDISNCCSSFRVRDHAPLSSTALYSEGWFAARPATFLFSAPVREAPCHQMRVRNLRGGLLQVWNREFLYVNVPFRFKLMTGAHGFYGLSESNTFPCWSTTSRVGAPGGRTFVHHTQWSVAPAERCYISNKQDCYVEGVAFSVVSRCDRTFGKGIGAVAVSTATEECLFCKSCCNRKVRCRIRSHWRACIVVLRRDTREHETRSPENVAEPRRRTF